MKKGEAGVIAAVIILISGALFTAFTSMPDITEQAFSGGAEAELSVYDRLKLEIQPYHFGNVPRESCAGDTTVWVVDLDHNMYSLAQADLRVTRILRELEFSSIVARTRAEGGVVFTADFPNGQPLQIHFTSP